VHHSDRGLQYARAEYIAILKKYCMIPSMSRPANPYDNASCESSIKTLKREEIYANKYGHLDQLRTNIEEFIEEYYNRQRLHSGPGYRIGLRATIFIRFEKWHLLQVDWRDALVPSADVDI
jgi:putative transposase